MTYVQFATFTSHHGPVAVRPFKAAFNKPSRSDAAKPLADQRPKTSFLAFGKELFCPDARCERHLHHGTLRKDTR